jgi:hypothetical protein
MGNIRLLPSKNPSKLIYSKVREDGKIIYKLVFSREAIKCNDGLLSGQRNIYITNNDYIGFSYYLDGDLVRKGVIDDKDYWAVRKDYKKIILTNDPDLIKDGVQEISDDFLLGFIKKPDSEYANTSSMCLDESQCKCDRVDSICKKIHYTAEIVEEEPPQPPTNTKNDLYDLMENDYDFNVQYHEATRESIYCFSVAIYDEKLPYREWLVKHYGKATAKQETSWISIVEGNIETYPKEGIDVLISDGKQYDVAYYLMSSTYVWMKVHPSRDEAVEFREFTPTMWKPII